jgi:branched-chain amino acid transport system substrate-binding protein
MGSGARDAAQLIVKKVNSQGGVNGNPIELFMYDDASDPSKGVMALKKLIEDDQVLAIIGPISTGIALACAPMAEKAQIPLFAQNSSSWSVAEKPWDIPKPPTKIRHWIFKSGIDPIFQDIAIYDMLKKLGAKRLAHMNVNNAMGKAMKESFEASYKSAGFEVVIWEEYGREDTDLTVPLTKIKAKGFDAVIIAGAEMAGAIAYKQAREMGITQPIIGMPPLAMGKLIEVVGKSLDGLMVPSYVVDLGEALPAEDPQRKPVVELNKLVVENTSTKKADTGHTAGWDGIYICVEALKRGNPDGGNLQKARAQLRDGFEKVKGYVGVQAIGDMTKWHEIPAPMIPSKVQDGKLIAIGKKITPTWADLE